MDLFLFQGGGRYITASFTVDEALSVTCMCTKEFIFHEHFYAILMLDLWRMEIPPPLAVVFLCCPLGTWINL